MKRFSAKVVGTILGLATWVLIFVCAFMLFNWVANRMTPEVQASTGDDMLYRRSVEAQVDMARAVKDIAESMRKVAEQGPGVQRVPVTVKCPHGCSPEQCLKLFTCE